MKNSKFILTLLIAATVTACNGNLNEDTSPELKVNKTSIQIDKNGGQYNVSYRILNPSETGKLEIYIQEEENAEWITLEEEQKDGVVSILAEKNSTDKDREATLVISYSEGKGNYYEIKLQQSGTYDNTDPIKINIIEVSTATVDIEFVPDDESELYFINYISEDYYKELGNTEKGLIDFYRKKLKELSGDSGLSIGEIAMRMSVTGKHEHTYRHLNEKTPFIAYAFHIDNDGEPSSDICMEKFTTLERNYTDLKVDFEIMEMTAISGKFKAIPSNGNDYYLWGIIEKTIFERYPSDDEFMLYTIAENYDTIGKKICKGESTKTYSGLSGLKPATDYILYAFGFNDDTYVTELQKKEIRTPDPGASEDLEIEITDDTRIFNTTAFFKPNDKTVRYLTDIIPEETYLEYGGNDAGLQKYFDELVVLLMEKYPQYKKDELLFRLQQFGDRNEVYQYLTDGTSYYLWAVAVDENGKFSCKPVMKKITTKEYVPADVWVDAYTEKYWIGDEVADMNPQFYTFRGAAVVPLRIKADEKAVHWYHIMIMDDVTDTQKYSSESIMQFILASGYTDAADDRTIMGAPFDKYVTLCSFSEDADGNYGNLTRHKYLFTENGASSIEEWPYDQFGAPKPTASAIPENKGEKAVAANRMSAKINRK